jgi:hypothetical protein
VEFNFLEIRLGDMVTVKEIKLKVVERIATAPQVTIHRSASEMEITKSHGGMS